ncbi:threonine synthase [Verticillium alfalfae VaMs.102]|uniref:Threonine synthase n=1 Tax=Verticillium alfalfae (strain VaMs.102 / ATCC MYA-4576 / FGSC 10136) TaxID=526221 RepID=C9SAJ7_VERA1|nr:threonine synthase [Verticillium alfalfae VaMs.102]EEY15445.1 threonine synthase [Verticillium alfalfae VaMs.102]
MAAYTFPPRSPRPKTGSPGRTSPSPSSPLRSSLSTSPPPRFPRKISRESLRGLFHGPTFAFKDVALQFLGNLFEYFLVRKNEGKTGRDRHHLTVVGATSGDTGSAAIYGLRGKKDVSVFILHPKGRVSPIQEAQMTTVLDDNVHNLAVTGTFDDCQDIVKALFADPEINKTHNLGAVNSINWARILRPGALREARGSRRRGPPVGLAQDGAKAHEDGAKETLNPAMDILVSNNFESLLWFLAYEFASSVGMGDEWNKKQAGQEVTTWLSELKTKGASAPSTRTSARTCSTAHGVASRVAASIERSGPEVPHILLSAAPPGPSLPALLSWRSKDEAGFDFAGKGAAAGVCRAREQGEEGVGGGGRLEAGAHCGDEAGRGGAQRPLELKRRGEKRVSASPSWSRGAQERNGVSPGGVRASATTWKR